MALRVRMTDGVSIIEVTSSQEQDDLAASGWSVLGVRYVSPRRGTLGDMAFTPVQYTNGSETRTASTPTDAVQLEYDGWWVSGTVEPALPLIDRFRFGPTPPPVAERRRGMIYIATPV